MPLLKNGLFVRNPLSNMILIIWNWFLSWKKRETIHIANSPKKIIVCNIANFGDVVISTTVLPVLKKKYPNCEIGFLTSTASAIVVKEHPSVARIHSFDHWYLHRHLGLCKAVLHHWKTRRRVLQELKLNAYDLAIDLYSYFPNAIPLLSKSNIPVRIGYKTGGFSNLLTHPVEWNFHHQYVAYAHLHLLKTLGIDVIHETPLPDYNYKQSNLNHIVVHLGSLNSLKEWKLENWISLINRLESDGYKIFLTGKGAREGEL